MVYYIAARLLPRNPLFAGRSTGGFILKRMIEKPYIVNSLELITRSWNHITLEILEMKVLRLPVQELKEKILRAFSTMTDTPVDVTIGVRYI